MLELNVLALCLNYVLEIFLNATSQYGRYLSDLLSLHGIELQYNNNNNLLYRWQESSLYIKSYNDTQFELMIHSLTAHQSPIGVHSADYNSQQ